jgi:hypothetical protein
MIEAKAVTIKLTSWQKRQLVAYLPSQKVLHLDPRRIDKILVQLGKGGCLASYRVLNTIHEGFEIYLTDAQIASVKKVLGPSAEVVAVTISADAIRKEAVVLMH